MKRAILALLLLLAVNAGANEGFGVGGAGATGPSGPTGASGAAGGGGGTGTTNQVIKFTNGAGGVIGDSGVSDDGTTVSSAEHISVTTKEIQQQYTNNTSTGTTTSKFVKWDGAGKIVVAAAATDAVKGICRTNCGTSGSAQVAISGASVACVFDNATTANHYVTVSSAGGCHDGGATFPTGTPVVGTIPSTNGGAGTYNIDLNGTDVASATIAGGGNGKIGGSGLQGQVAYFSGTTTLAGAGPTSGAIPYWDSTTTMAASGLQAANTVMVGGGAGTAPSTAPGWIYRPTQQGGTITFTNSSDNYGLQVTGTFNSAGGGYAGVFADGTTAGSGAGAAFNGVFSILRAGYTGAGTTTAGFFETLVANTSVDLGLGAGAQPPSDAALVGYAARTGTGAGTKVGGYFSAAGSTTANYGLISIAPQTIAGSNIGAAIQATNSTEGTDWVNLGFEVSLISGTNPFISGVNASVGGIIDSNGNDEMRFYNNKALQATIASDGSFSTVGTITSSKTTNIGWTPVAGANTACNTTCTSACVFGTDSVTGGILACTDATADVCLCAGSS